MSSMFDLINSKSESAKFQDHPVSFMPLEMRLLYLYGLSLVLGSIKDNKLHGSGYFTALMNSFIVDPSMQDDFISFSRSPDEDFLSEFISTFSEAKEKNVFIFDMLVMAIGKRGLNSEKVDLVNKVSKDLDIESNIFLRIKKIVSLVIKENWPAALDELDEANISCDDFRYFVSFYDVDYEAHYRIFTPIDKDFYIKKIRHNVNKNFFNYLLWEPIEYEIRIKNKKYRKISQPISIQLDKWIDSHIAMAYLQFKLDIGSYFFEIVKHCSVFGHESLEVVIKRSNGDRGVVYSDNLTSLRDRGYGTKFDAKNKRFVKLDQNSLCFGRQAWVDDFVSELTGTNIDVNNRIGSIFHPFLKIIFEHDVVGSIWTTKGYLLPKNFSRLHKHLFFDDNDISFEAIWLSGSEKWYAQKYNYSSWELFVSSIYSDSDFRVCFVR
jgi:hypothetical protein